MLLLLWVVIRLWDVISLIALRGWMVIGITGCLSIFSSWHNLSIMILKTRWIILTEWSGTDRWQGVFMDNCRCIFILDLCLKRRNCRWWNVLEMLLMMIDRLMMMTWWRMRVGINRRCRRRQLMMWRMLNKWNHHKSTKNN